MYNRNMPVKIQYAIVKYSLSKGDLMRTETLGIFETLDEAKTSFAVNDYSKKGGFRWSDWDEYRIVRVEDGKYTDYAD